MEWLGQMTSALGFALALAIQTTAVIFWAARLEAAVRSFDQRIKRLEENEQHAETESRRVAEGLARLEERLAAQTRVLEDIRERLGR